MRLGHALPLLERDFVRTAEVLQATGVVGDAGDRLTIRVRSHAHIKRIVAPHPGNGPEIRALGTLRAGQRRGADQQRKRAKDMGAASKHEAI